MIELTSDRSEKLKQRMWLLYIRSNKLLTKLEIDDLDIIPREKRLRWFGHVECSSGAIKTACDIQIDGKRGPGWPKMSCKTLTQRDRREWNLNKVDPCVEIKSEFFHT